MTRKEHIASSVVIILASGACLGWSIYRAQFVGATNFTGSNLAINPYLFPGIVMGFALFLGVLRLIVGLRMPKTDEPSLLLKIPAKSLITLGLIGFYALAFDKLGFVLSSFIYLFAQISVLWKENRKPWRIVLISTVGSVGVYLLFSKGFNVLLPRGILTFL